MGRGEAVSAKQMAYQQRHRLAGLCLYCPTPAAENATVCESCRTKRIAQKRNSRAIDRRLAEKEHQQ